MHVAVIFDNFGPYHVARLSGAAASMQVTGIEVAGVSSDYAWARPADGDFARVTLFPDGNAARQTAEVATAMETCLADARPDVIAIPGWADKAGLAALRWARRNAVPVIVMSESNGEDERRRPHRELVKRLIVGQCDAGLAGGTRAAAYLRALGLAGDRIALGYDVVDNDHYARGARAARADAAATRARLALPERYFLCCCRFIPKKNLAFLIAGYADYRAARGPDACKLVIAGDGALRPALERQVAALGLADCVLFPGFTQYDGLPALYGLAAGFVLASTTEQWGLVVNEAMASGLPVLVSERCGSAADLVENGRNGHVFDPTDRAALVAGLHRIDADGVALGRQSEAIIAQWGPARFGRGLKAMADTARATGPRRTGLAHRLALGLMLR